MGNKQKLVALVSALEEENIIDYCYTFIGLKVCGKAKFPDSIREELGQLWERRMLPHMEQQESQELTEDEKAAMRHRYEITRAIYHITSVEVLNYIHIIVAGVYKDIQKAGAI
ncbi:hypothetical protein AALB64_16090 [Lachnospiraceae bacterium 45-P1]